MEKFRIYTRGLIFDDQKNVLLIQKQKDQKYWAWKFMPPGWTVEFGEDVEKTLSREIKEETNLDVKSADLFAVRKIMINDEHRLWVYYLVEVEGTEKLKNLEPEKHQICDFLNPLDIWNFVHKDLIVSFLK